MTESRLFVAEKDIKIWVSTYHLGELRRGKTTQAWKNSASEEYPHPIQMSFTQTLDLDAILRPDQQTWREAAELDSRSGSNKQTQILFEQEKAWLAANGRGNR